MNLDDLPLDVVDAAFFNTVVAGFLATLVVVTLVEVFALLAIFRRTDVFFGAFEELDEVGFFVEPLLDPPPLPEFPVCDVVVDADTVCCTFTVDTDTMLICLKSTLARSAFMVV